MPEFYQGDLFADNLPRWLYACDDYADVRKLPRTDALARAHIAPNPKNAIWCLTFDVDRPDGGAAWVDADLPPPNWTAQNPQNGHAHLGYALLAPVSRSELSRSRPIRLLARVQHAMSGAMQADSTYAHWLTKTPGHPRHRTIWGRQHPYSLDELRRALPENLPLPARIRRGEAVGVGRNVTLFDGLRFWAYRARLQFGDFERWRDACRLHAACLNTFACPLPCNEVRHTADSVARWTWRHITPQGFADAQARAARALNRQKAAAATARQMSLLDLME